MVGQNAHYVHAIQNQENIEEKNENLILRLQLSTWKLPAYEQSQYNRRWHTNKTIKLPYGHGRTRRVTCKLCSFVAREHDNYRTKGRKHGFNQSREIAEYGGGE